VRVLGDVRSERVSPHRRTAARASVAAGAAASSSSVCLSALLG
jgi:hypothetical protein